MSISNTEHKNDGFSLIEVMIAMVIFAVGILAIASMQLSAIRGNDMAREMSEAANIGMERLENFMLMDYNAAQLTPTTVHTANEGKYALTWTVTSSTPGTPATDFKTINMQITWADVKGGQRHVNINHVIAEINQ